MALRETGNLSPPGSSSSRTERSTRLQRKRPSLAGVPGPWELESGLRGGRVASRLPLRSGVWPHTHMVDESRTVRQQEACRAVKTQGGSEQGGCQSLGTKGGCALLMAPTRIRRKGREGVPKSKQNFSTSPPSNAAGASEARVQTNPQRQRSNSHSNEAPLTPPTLKGCWSLGSSGECVPLPASPSHCLSAGQTGSGSGRWAGS